MNALTGGGVGRPHTAHLILENKSLTTTFTKHVRENVFSVFFL